MDGTATITINVQRIALIAIAAVVLIASVFAAKAVSARISAANDTSAEATSQHMGHIVSTVRLGMAWPSGPANTKNSARELADSLPLFDDDSADLTIASVDREGVFPTKTLTVNVHFVPERDMSHPAYLWVGMIDSDGGKYYLKVNDDAVLDRADPHEEQLTRERDREAADRAPRVV